MDKINIQIKGVKKLTKQLENISKEVDNEVEAITRITAEDISTNAKFSAPVGTPESTGIKGYLGGTLRQSITAFAVNSKTWAVAAFAKYAPYVEFGTGGSVEVPNELKDLAIRFKGKGIRRINLPARPFLYPAFVKGRGQYIKDLKKLLKRVTK